LLGTESISKGGIIGKDLSELAYDVKPLKDGIDTVIPANFGLNKVAIGIKEVTELVESLDE
jgi:hypothetical protein